MVASRQATTKEVGAAAIGGTMNQSGGLVIEAQKVGHDTMLSRIF